MINKICICLASIMIAMFLLAGLNLNNKNLTFASDSESHNSGRSLIPSNTIFVHTPTFSVVYNNDIYFIDEYDNLLKVFNQEENRIKNALSIESLGEIIDVSYLNEHMIILSKIDEDLDENLNISFINLPDLAIESTLKLETNSLNYCKIDICEYEETNLIISLTPTIENIESEEIQNPLLITYSKSDSKITNICEIELETAAKNSYFKLMTINATNSVNDLFLVHTYGTEICFFGCMFDTISSNSTLSVSMTSGSALKSLALNEFTTLIDINKIVVEDKLLFLNTYSSTHIADGITTTSTHSEIYEYIYENVSDENKDKDKSPVKSINHLSNSKTIMISNGFVVYPILNEQQIAYTKITYNAESQQYTDITTTPVGNPAIQIVYYDEENFEYVTANKKTMLLNLPWEPTDSLKAFEINPEENPKDLIIIGEGKIEGENSTIEDYKYCLFTTVDKNLKGFVKSEDLTLKTKIEPINYDYKVFKVQPNTILYSMPTTIINDNITPTLSSKEIDIIKENSKVEVIDPICKYISNNKIMLKVLVNGTISGYIEYDKIIKPSDSIEFIITNASIKINNTNIYLNPDQNSPITYTLNKGYRIRINGVRNTESGYTSITFNDEYGNEFSGYVLTDSISSDSWTTMQIIGCILIAINIGLLVLIIRFKKNSIGNNGAKYLENKK